MGNRPTTDAGRFRSVPERSPDFAHLSLDGLRKYRLALSEEESRGSYWRRIVQARLAPVGAGRAGAAEGGTAPPVDNRRAVFAGPRVAGARKALLPVVPADDIPPLPDLAEVWA